MSGREARRASFRSKLARVLRARLLNPLGSANDAAADRCARALTDNFQPSHRLNPRAMCSRVEKTENRDERPPPEEAITHLYDYVRRARSGSIHVNSRRNSRSRQCSARKLLSHVLYLFCRISPLSCAKLFTELLAVTIPELGNLSLRRDLVP